MWIFFLISTRNCFWSWHYIKDILSTLLLLSLNYDLYSCFEPLQFRWPGSPKTKHHTHAHINCEGQGPYRVLRLWMNRKQTLIPYIEQDCTRRLAGCIRILRKQFDKILCHHQQFTVSQYNRTIKSQQISKASILLPLDEIQNIQASNKIALYYLYSC